MKYLTIFFLIIGCTGGTQITETDPDESRSNEIREIKNSDEESFFLTEDFDEVLKTAKRSKKSVIVHFGAEWCLPCKQMRRITYKDDNVKSAIENQFFPFRVDVDYFTGMDIADKYGVKKYPTVITLDYRGNVITFTEGYVGPVEMLGLLN